MGYFSNGTEGMAYEAEYCDRCIHQDGKDGESGCAIWLAHMLHNYDLLIPRGDGKTCWNEECAMFVEKKVEDKRQMHLFPNETPR